ncbi:MAG: prepilin-type N-terminal cleavage/methylation domain-containing protein [Verrucomicrobiales bacterium]|jgi:prepilin-type N-terminal cleavage/methylation domain-containing protein
MKKFINAKESGFSLVELLVVIAVIGLIAAIAIPQISKITDKAQIASDQRNAQNVVGVYGAAVAAGYTAGTVVDTTDVSSYVDALVLGVNGTNTFADSQFKISSLDDTTKGRVAGYMTVDTQTPPNLTYVPNP